MEPTATAPPPRKGKYYLGDRVLAKLDQLERDVATMGYEFDPVDSGVPKCARPARWEQLKKQAYDRTQLLQVNKLQLIPEHAKKVISAFLAQGDELGQDPMSVSAPQANAYEFQSQVHWLASAAAPRTT